MMAKGREFSEVATRAMACMNTAVEADGVNRAAAIEDLKFSYGDQWPAEIQMQRQLDRRPCLTINKTDTFVRSVVNNMRQQRPRIKVHPVDSGADIKKAELIEGIFRHIEVQSNAELAYDTAADYQVRIGIGYLRVVGRYLDERSFDQELYIERVRNPFSVYYDPSSTQPDGLDCEWCVITDRIRKSEFKKQYPGFSDQDFTPSGEGDGQQSWSSKEETLIAEYWRVEMVPDVLFKLSSGDSIFKSESEGAKDVGDYVGDAVVIDKRDSMKRTVKWSKVTKSQELESRVWAGKYIPVIPVYGAEMLEDGHLTRSGMVRQLKDPQRMYNFWRTQETEFVALAPKAPWLIAEGQVENHEDEWATANIKNHSTLTYKPILDESGNPVPMPQRLQPQAVPAASINAAMAASEDLKAVAGMFDPSLGAPGQETSGTMVMQRQQQSDLSNYHFYDNLTRSIRAVGIVLLDLLKTYYSGQRAIRIIGADGNPDTVTINEQNAEEVLNDISVGRYDVIMETGPGYNTKRQEASASMIEAMKFMPQLGQLAGDIIFGQMDWPGANEIAERLKMANPLAQVADKVPEDVDPKAQQLIGQLMGQLQQAQQQLQQLTKEKEAHVFGVEAREKAVTEREVMKQLAEAQRLHIKEKGDTDRNTQDNDTWMQDTHMKVTTSWEQAKLDAAVALEIERKRGLQGQKNDNNNIRV